MPDNLYIMPTCGSALWEPSRSYFTQPAWWQIVYEDMLSEEEKVIITDAFRNAIPQLSYSLPKSYGPRIEDRKCQITFSALGQQAPLEEKRKWDPHIFKRQELKVLLRKYLHDEFEIRIGGTTSVDITRKGIDKSYGVAKLCKYLNLEYQDVLFVGDALFAGGNDYPVKAMGIECVETDGPERTMEIIKGLLEK